MWHSDNWKAQLTSGTFPSFWLKDIERQHKTGEATKQSLGHTPRDAFHSFNISSFISIVKFFVHGGLTWYALTILILLSSIPRFFHLVHKFIKKYFSRFFTKTIYSTIMQFYHSYLNSGEFGMNWFCWTHNDFSYHCFLILIHSCWFERNNISSLKGSKMISTFKLILGRRRVL